jgi:hypothetical protein
VKYKDLLHDVVAAFESLHESLSSKECYSLNANQVTQFKESRRNHFYHFCPKITDLFGEFFNSPAGSTPWKK